MTSYQVRLKNIELAKDKNKFCSRCEYILPYSAFGKNKRHKDGLTNHCQDCKNANYRKWSKTNEKVREKAKRDYHENKPKHRDWELKRVFGISLDNYNEMLKKQNGVCKICYNPEVSKKSKVLSVDHCHTTGKIRGLLCSNCNLGLGNLKDSIKFLENAINYLKETQ